MYIYSDLLNSTNIKNRTGVNFSLLGKDFGGKDNKVLTNALLRKSVLFCNIANKSCFTKETLKTIMMICCELLQNFCVWQYLWNLVTASPIIIYFLSASISLKAKKFCILILIDCPYTFKKGILCWLGKSLTKYIFP